MSRERVREILEERARRLAEGIDVEESHADDLEVITFRVSNEHYALESRYVREVVRHTDFTPVPGGPEHLLGATNLRGVILPIFELRVLLGLHQKSISDLFRVMVIGVDRVEFGLLVDEVEAVDFVSPERLDEVRSDSGSRGLIRGVTDEALILLDGGALLSDRRLFVAAGDTNGDAGVKE